jgi:spoIIIJ-associated protein
MIKTVEATGKTREAAVRAALLELGITENDSFDTEVITMPKSGFLGIGAIPAKVRITYDDGRPEPRPAPAPAPKKAEPAPEKPKKAAPAPAAPRAEKPAAPAAPRPEKTPAPAPSFDEGSREERTYAFLTGLLERMGVKCDIVISRRENGGLDVKLDGPNMGAVIGRRGETLDAIQHLVNYAINRGNEKQGHISVDAEDYSSKREE